MCRKCHGTFKAPLMDRKRNIAAGWTLPNSGVVICPHCRRIDLRSNYDVVGSEGS